MSGTNKDEYELAAEIVIAVIQSGQLTSYEAEDIVKYYSDIYEGIHQLKHEEFKKATSNVELP